MEEYENRLYVIIYRKAKARRVRDRLMNYLITTWNFKDYKQKGVDILFYKNVVQHNNLKEAQDDLSRIVEDLKNEILPKTFGSLKAEDICLGGSCLNVKDRLCVGSVNKYIEGINK